ncbi:MAG: twin-arginine translocation signal domain-containing protein [Planctomycetia bacterium]|nr:twin-arginine translocation signal domain-containing protein [Planctomycetia bacterium]
MVSRRSFLQGVGTGVVGAGVIGPSLLNAGGVQEKRKKLAVVTTLWNYRSHAWHMAERFLVGYPREGKWHRPELQVVSAYVDQTPEGDLSRGRAKEFGFRIFPTVAEALRAGGDKLAVDAVLLIGEHGNYPVNEIGQKQYPRYELFRQIVDVFKKDGRTTPVYNDKHLSWRFEWAKEMVETARAMKFPLLAGSSLPVTWRMPAIDMPLGAEVEEALCVAFGPVDIYDFHALETIQCMVERRKGGETGVVAMQAQRGDAVWQAMESGAWSGGGWDARLFEACLSRSHTLAQPDTCSHRYPTAEQMRQFVKQPVAYRFEYADGLKATMLLLNGLVEDFTFAARLKGQREPISTLFHLPPNPNVVYSAALMSKAEEMFTTGRAPYPAERTLLTSGLVAAGLKSLATGQKRIETPQLAVRYEAPRESQFWRS